MNNFSHTCDWSSIRNLEISTYERFNNSYCLIPINRIFDGLLFGIKFIMNSV